jgi:phage gp37-like protein
MSLTPRTARTTIEKAIVSAISLALKYRYPQINDTADLRLLVSNATPHNALRFMVSKGVCYKFNRYTNNADDNDQYIKPTDVGSTKPGRWVKTNSKNEFGYLKTVEAYNGQSDIESVIEKLIGQRPSVLVVWTGADHKTRSVKPGALYWYECNFDIWAIGTNYRDQDEAEEGSEVLTEYAADPGVNQIIGDLKQTLAGINYGIEGVDRTELRDEQRIASDLAQRTALERLGITVYATLNIADDASDIITINSIAIQKQLADAPVIGGPIGPGNYILYGYRYNFPSGLTATMSPGSAYVGTNLISSSPAVHSFTPNKHTYRDLKLDGTFIYTTVDPYFVPAQAPNTLRVGVTVTNASSITFDQLLASSLIDYGSPDIISTI